MKKPMNIRHLNVDGLPESNLRDKVFCFPFFTFIYLTEGECLVEVKGRQILVGPGQLLIIPDNLPVSVKYYHACIGFDDRFDLDFLKDASYPALHTGAAILQSFWFDDAVFMASLMQRMLVAREDKDNAFLRSALDLVICQLRPSGKVAAVPEKFLQMVFEQGSIPLGVSDYAEKLGVTPNYLNKTVKNHTHRTAIDWIEIERLNLAKTLLKDPSKSILDIAIQTGLDDQSYFSRFFKKKTGLTPSEYRKSS